MGYVEARLQREVQQLKRDLNNVKARERQTRQGCLDLADALKGFVTSVESSNDPASSRISELVEQAGALLAPNSNEL